MIKFPFRVSTHSRLKAAGLVGEYISPHTLSFNTQPPEGGWRQHKRGKRRLSCFNTQPPEGGWLRDEIKRPATEYVSTHSRLKAAGLPR